MPPCGNGCGGAGCAGQAAVAYVVADADSSIRRDRMPQRTSVSASGETLFDASYGAEGAKERTVSWNSYERADPS